MRPGVLWVILGISFLDVAAIPAQEADLPRGAGDPALVRAIDPLLERPAVRGARFSLLVAPLDGGPPAYALDPDRPLHPASNTKLFTVAAALDRLGPDYTYQTDLAAGELKDGVADHVYLIGRGDPRFVSESLWRMVEVARYEAGLRAVRGDVVVDDTYFTDRVLAPGFDEKDTDSAYRAATGAMSLNFNSLVVYVRPGAKPGDPARVDVQPDCGYAVVEVTATTIRRGRTRVDIRARPHADRTRVVVSGRIALDHPGVSARRRIDNPPLFAGLAARDMLRRAGVEVGGEVRVAAAPETRVLLARHESPALARLVADVNKLSNNFMAETLVRTLGAVRRGKGSWEAGRAEVIDFLEKEVGLSGFRYENGSGLFGDTAFSASQIVRLLRYMARRRPALPEFAASLAIAGADGTLDRRLRALEVGRIRAKTGTLNGVVCISGYTYFADGTPAVFSLLMNDTPGVAWDVWQVQDAMLQAITEHRPSSGPRAER